MAHIPRIYRPGRVEPGPIVFHGEAAKRLGNVLRLHPGDPFLLFAGDGREWRATVVSAGRGDVHAQVSEIERREPAPALTLEVWCALVRANRFDLAIEKCTEAGADIIRPLTTDHTVRGDAASGNRSARWERIAIEAAEQCGRLTLPAIASPVAFAAALKGANHPLIMGDPGGRTWPETIALLPEAGRVAVAVGPEGGWSAAELAAARAHGALLTSLGPNILRTETAAIAMTALVRAWR